LINACTSGLQRTQDPPRIQPQATPAQQGSRHGLAAHVVLIGCVRTKRAIACAAAELFASPLFDGRRRYAVASGLPWYILSAKFGLLAPEDVIGPYDVYLGEQSLAYRKAWGEFVTAQLGQRQSVLRGRTIEVHTGIAYAEPLRAPLAAQRATLITPLAHLRQASSLPGTAPAFVSIGPPYRPLRPQAWVIGWTILCAGCPTRPRHYRLRI